MKNKILITFFCLFLNAVKETNDSKQSAEKLIAQWLYKNFKNREFSFEDFKKVVFENVNSSGKFSFSENVEIVFFHLLLQKIIIKEEGKFIISPDLIKKFGLNSFENLLALTKEEENARAKINDEELKGRWKIVLQKFFNEFKQKIIEEKDLIKLSKDLASKDGFIIMFFCFGGFYSLILNPCFDCLYEEYTSQDGCKYIKKIFKLKGSDESFEQFFVGRFFK